MWTNLLRFISSDYSPPGPGPGLDLAVEKPPLYDNYDKSCIHATIQGRVLCFFLGV